MNNRTTEDGRVIPFPVGPSLRREGRGGEREARLRRTLSSPSGSLYTVRSSPPDSSCFSLGIAGSRTFSSPETMRDVADDYISQLSRVMGRCVCIMTGDMFGADDEASSFAKSRGIPFKIFEARDDTDRSRTRRNQAIIDSCDALLLFWDGRSPGTKQKFDMAMAKGIPISLQVFKH